jgi:hypothetical protein
MKSCREKILALATVLRWYTCVGTLVWPLLALAQSPQEGSGPAPAAPATTPPQTIDDLIVSIRSHLDDDFLCWEAEKIEKYWEIRILLRTKASSKENEMGVNPSNSVRAKSLDNYTIYSRTFVRNGENYKGIDISFYSSRNWMNSRQEISYDRLFQVFGKPTLLSRLEIEIPPPPPGQLPVEIKREGDLQITSIEWENLSPNVLILADTGFRSEIRSLMVLRKMNEACK